jgi:DNA-binding beta-propeller fold protein YncE
MKGDFTRLTYDPGKSYTRVLKQQGRVDLDADWNEAGAIQAYLDQILVKDVVGKCGVPKKNAGFLVGIAPGDDLTLSEGRIYVGGLLCETEGSTYKEQPHLPNPPPIEVEEEQVDLVYLDTWQRHITAVEDPELLEEALGGADTTTRLKTVWQVKVRPGVEESECEGEFEPWPPLPPLDRRGQLTTSTTATPDESDPCLIAPGGGYHGLENRLYRVEIHDGGHAYTWPRPTGVVATEVTAISNGTEVTVSDWSLDGRAWQVGQSVELYSQQSNAGGTAGIQARVTAVDEANGKLTLSTDVSSMAGHSDRRLRRLATFKWSRDNGSVVLAINEFVAGQPTKVRVRRLGRDQVLTLHPNDYVEILGDETELKGLPGTLAAIAPDGIDEAGRILTLDRDVSVHAGEQHARVRRWDQKSETVAVTTDLLTLEDGVQIQFGGREMITGDYWTFAARTATGRTDELVKAPPQGIAHYYCRLALITWGTEAGTTRALIGVQDGEAVPDLATAWEDSEDGREWTLKLADDVTLPDGEPLTAEYVAEILAEEGYEVEVIDDYTLKLFALDEEGFLKLNEIPIIEEEGLEAHVEDCRPDFPTLTEICAEDVCYDDGQCDAIQAETVQEALDQLCAMRDLRHHNKHLHGWGIVCGLQVHCGPDDPDRPGDRLKVSVLPGYAIDCEGNDIVLEGEMAVPVLRMIEEWEEEHGGKPLLENGQGKVCLVIERDEHGQPCVVLRPYDPKDDTLKAMLEGTLLMDFVQDCIVEPMQEIRELLLPPADEREDDRLVGAGQRQIISMLNLAVQFWNSEHGKHVYLSAKEHEILRNLYLALRAILQSKTFCAMFDKAHPFPDYPFDKARMSTIFDAARNRRRLRIHPSERLGYSVGVDAGIHVYDLAAEEVIAIVDMPGGAGLVVQDVAFSEDGKQLYAVGTLRDKDSVFAVANIEGLPKRWPPVPGGGVRPRPIRPKVDGVVHKWQPSAVLCDVQLLTLARIPDAKESVLAVGRGNGLYTIKLGDVEPSIKLSREFNAVGHLVIDAEGKRVYASAADREKKGLPTAYDRVVEIEARTLKIVNEYRLLRADADGNVVVLTGEDDIAFANWGPVGPQGRMGKVCAVADDAERNLKLLFTFRRGQPEEPAITVLPATTISLGHVPSSPYLVVAAEDHYSLYLVGLQQDNLLDGYQLPVQIAPVDIALTPKGERAYVINALSPTLTAIAAEHLQPSEGGGEEPAPGSQEFLETLIAYRQDILSAYADLLGGLLQYLKDCFCHHLLVNCPECDPEDEVYLASVSIQGSEVYQVCNFSRRRYVKSFPTVGYWLSLIPISPLIHKAVEMVCCLALPELFGQFVPQQMAVYQAPVKSYQMRTGLAAFQQGIIQKQASEVLGRVNLAQQVAGEWMGQTIAQSVTRPAVDKEALTKNEVVGEPIEEAIRRAEQKEIVAKVEPYVAAEGAANLRRLTRTPLRIPPGSEVTFYEKDGVVRYYALTEKAAEPVEAIREEVEAQKEKLTEVATLKATVAELRGELTRKDDELTALRKQIKMVESKQAELEAAPEREKLKAVEAEMEEMRAFRDEVKKFMRRGGG